MVRVKVVTVKVFSCLILLMSWCFFSVKLRDNNDQSRINCMHASLLAWNPNGDNTDWLTYTYIRKSFIKMMTKRWSEFSARMMTV